MTGLRTCASHERPMDVLGMVPGRVRGKEGFIEASSGVINNCDQQDLFWSPDYPQVSIEESCCGSLLMRACFYWWRSGNRGDPRGLELNETDRWPSAQMEPLFQGGCDVKTHLRTESHLASTPTQSWEENCI